MYTLLVAVDESEHAQSAVRYAIDIARRMSAARVLLVNVQPPAMSGEVSNLLSAEEVMEQHMEKGRAALAGAQAAFDAAGIAYEMEICIGKPAESIVECAGKLGGDVIVLGASSHGRVASLVLGSVAERVLRIAELPVTVVK